MVMVNKIGKDVKWKYLFLVALMTYIFFVFYMAVISRDNVVFKNTVRLDLFQCYYQPSGDNYRDVLVNIVVFIPVGLLAGLLSRRHLVPKALLAGLLLSLAIEFSQLLWSRGVFDVDDIFNNSLGALIGGAIAMCLLRIRKPINGTGRHIRR